MPETRHTAAPESTPHGAGRLPHGFRMEPHSHGEGQLIYAAAGALATTTERGTWVAPADRVTWTPPGFEHAHRVYGETDVRLIVIPRGLGVESPSQSLHLPEPGDDRLRTVTGLLHDDPGRNDTLAELGRAAGASERTLSRLFHAELGMSFHRWRTVLRIHHGLIHLTGGRSVTETAHACGWSNPASFIEAFAAVVGQTPGRYQASLRRS
jgi:AraC-like DNA-binding protein